MPKKITLNSLKQPTEKDRLFTMTNKLRKAQSISGYISAPNFWRRINGLQTHIIHHTCHEIIDKRINNIIKNLERQVVIGEIK